MIAQALTCIVIFIASALLAGLLGKYMSRVYKGERSVLDFLQPVERFIFKICGIDPDKDMSLKEYILSMLCINCVWFIWTLVILLCQGKLPLNPAGNSSMEWTLAVNSAISFLTSTNLQHYAGESGATYFSQMAGFMFLQFVSAATSLAVGVAVVRGLITGSAHSLGNFYNDFVKSLTRILLPLSVIVAILFLLSGMPMTFHGYESISGLEGNRISIATGPVAAMIPIKELGANGGGFFGANDAHPFENPNFLTFIIHSIIVFLLPVAFVFMIGYYLNQKRFARMLFAIMTIGFVLVLLPMVICERAGNPMVKKMGIDISTGNMEGKEIRFGSVYSAFFGAENAVISVGAVMGQPDSFMPLSGGAMILGMNIDAFFGGLGTGWINMHLFLIVAVFIGTLMIGRTPEIFGKKIEIRETQIAVGVIVLQTLVPLALTAIACFVYCNYPGGNQSLSWISNKGSHGFTTMLYEYVSSYAGNGSEFSGLGNNTPFWNLTTSLAMLCGRYIPIIGALAIAGLLRQKQWICPSPGSLRVDSTTFGAFLLAVIIAVNGLSLLVVVMLGPIAESFMR